MPGRTERKVPDESSQKDDDSLISKYDIATPPRSVIFPESSTDDHVFGLSQVTPKISRGFYRQSLGEATSYLARYLTSCHRVVNGKPRGLWSEFKSDCPVLVRLRKRARQAQRSSNTGRGALCSVTDYIAREVFRRVNFFWLRKRLAFQWKFRLYWPLKQACRRMVCGTSNVFPQDGKHITTRYPVLVNHIEQESCLTFKDVLGQVLENSEMHAWTQSMDMRGVDAGDGSLAYTQNGVALLWRVPRALWSALLNQSQTTFDGDILICKPAAGSCGRGIDVFRYSEAKDSDVTSKSAPTHATGKLAQFCQFLTERYRYVTVLEKSCSVELSKEAKTRFVVERTRGDVVLNRLHLETVGCVMVGMGDDGSDLVIPGTQIISGCKSPPQLPAFTSASDFQSLVAESSLFMTKFPSQTTWSLPDTSAHFARPRLLVQEYLTDPLLMYGKRKFDLRVYVLLLPAYRNKGVLRDRMDSKLTMTVFGSRKEDQSVVTGDHHGAFGEYCTLPSSPLIAFYRDGYLRQCVVDYDEGSLLEDGSENSADGEGKSENCNMGHISNFHVQRKADIYDAKQDSVGGVQVRIPLASFFAWLDEGSTDGSDNQHLEAFQRNCRAVAKQRGWEWQSVSQFVSLSMANAVRELAERASGHLVSQAGRACQYAMLGVDLMVMRSGHTKIIEVTKGPALRFYPPYLRELHTTMLRDMVRVVFGVYERRNAGYACSCKEDTTDDEGHCALAHPVLCWPGHCPCGGKDHAKGEVLFSTGQFAQVYPHFAF